MRNQSVGFILFSSLLLFGLGVFGAPRAIDLSDAQVFSVLAFPQNQTAMVGLVSQQTGYAAFATCLINGNQLEACEFESTEQFIFNAESILRLRDLFFGSLAEACGSSLPATLQQSYSRLFQTNFNFLSFAVFDSGRGLLTEEQTRQALKQAVLELN